MSIEHLYTAFYQNIKEAEVYQKKALVAEVSAKRNVPFFTATINAKHFAKQLFVSINATETVLFQL